MTLRELFERSNATCQRLIREEDGVVLGVMVVTLMSLFLMAAATFAVGEHIRDRIEIQNAVDAAAYSAAVVEADTISRVAAINQAIAWTYVQMAKRHIHYITAKWLVEVDNEVWGDYQDILSHKVSWPSTVSSSGLYDVTLNRNSTITPKNLRALASGLRANVTQQLQSDIASNRRDIDDMHNAQTNLMGSMTRRVKDTAEAVLRMNLGPSTDLQFNVLFGPDDQPVQLDNLHKLGETHFLSSIGLTTDGAADSAIGPGADGGSRRFFPSRPLGTDPWRKYQNASNALIAEWNYNRRGRRRIYTTYGSYWKYSPTIHRAGTVKGSQAQGSDPLFRIDSIDPLGLKKSYFEGDGTILVACARPIRHPFRLFINNGGSGGFYDAFKGADANNKPRYMMAVSASRAGYRDGSEGNYNPCNDMISGNSFYNSTKNLGETDWDAVLIPIRRAWTGRAGGTWDTGHEADVLKELWEGNRWQSLSGGWTGSLQGQGQLPGAVRMLKFDKEKSILTGFGTTPEKLSKSLYH
jgi:Flp pilus assembly protein TadG